LLSQQAALHFIQKMQCIKPHMQMVTRPGNILIMPHVYKGANAWMAPKGDF
jgi:hypothetical protein